MSAVIPGPIALLGSGETLPSSGKTHEFVARRLPDKPRIVILETPAGFEPNSDFVAEVDLQYVGGFARLGKVLHVDDGAGAQFHFGKVIPVYVVHQCTNLCEKLANGYE